MFFTVAGSAATPPNEAPVAPARLVPSITTLAPTGPLSGVTPKTISSEASGAVGAIGVPGGSAGGQARMVLLPSKFPTDASTNDMTRLDVLSIRLWVNTGSALGSV